MAKESKPSSVPHGTIAGTPIEQMVGFVEVMPELGRVNGEPFVRIGGMSGGFTDAGLEGLSESAARHLLRVLNHGYTQAFSKLMQFSNHVPKEVSTRDPATAVAIFEGARAGKSDQEIAAELGETVKFVQRMRTSMGAPMKRQRGRPRMKPSPE